MENIKGHLRQGTKSREVFLLCSLVIEHNTKDISLERKKSAGRTKKSNQEGSRGCLGTSAMKSNVINVMLFHQFLFQVSFPFY